MLGSLLNHRLSWHSGGLGARRPRADEPDDVPDRPHKTHQQAGRPESEQDAGEDAGSALQGAGHDRKEADPCRSEYQPGAETTNHDRSIVMAKGTGTRLPATIRAW